MNILVTGGTGFIGHPLVKQLVLSEHNVTVACRTPDNNLSQSISFFQASITDQKKWQQFDQPIDIIIHLAALITFDKKRINELLHVNRDGTKNMIETGIRLGASRFILVSSSCTLGVSNNLENILDENDTATNVQIEDNPYLYSKLEAEKTVSKYLNEIEVIILSPTTIYGPGDKDLNSGTLIQKVATSPIVLIPPGGTNVVDIDDVVSGILLAMEYGNSGERYVLGNENLLFRQIVNEVKKVTLRQPISIPVWYGFKGIMSFVAGILGKMTKSRFITPQIINDLFDFKYYSHNKAKRELGWSPKYSFNKSVQRAWHFYQKNGLIK